MSQNPKVKSGLSRLYISKSTLLKSFLLFGILAISAVFVWYTFNVIEKLKDDTRSQVEKYVRLWQITANSPTSGNELQFILNEIIVKATFPMIVLDDNRNLLYWRNIKGIPSDDTSTGAVEKLLKIADEMRDENGEFPLYFGEDHVNYLYYGDSEVITQLKMMPFIEIGIVLAFMVIGIIGFQNIRKSEERHIWVGMAKETAHQLGTPISSLMGWLEMIEAEKEECTSAAGEIISDETIDNMKIDIDRLQRVANRFGMIGSIPEHHRADLNHVVLEVVEYYRRRLPFSGHGIRIDFSQGRIPSVKLNTELFSWALENMVKNSLQAVDSKTGRISLVTDLTADKKKVCLKVTDNGPGITAAAARKIFKAGFTTKKRGWGLGLTLVKRIVEEYHGGEIWLESSHPGETVFEIDLPIENENKENR